MYFLVCFRLINDFIVVVKEQILITVLVNRPETFHQVVRCDNEEEKSATLEVQNGYLVSEIQVYYLGSA